MKLNPFLQHSVDKTLAFYHASPEPLPLGKDLVQQKRTRGLPGSHVLDKSRPKGLPPRDDHHFMVEDVQCLTTLGQTSPDLFVYEVRPTSPVTEANFAWAEDITTP